MNGFDDLRYFGDVLAQANCVKLCEEEHPYGKTISDLPELVSSWVFNHGSRPPKG